MVGEVRGDGCGSGGGKESNQWQWKSKWIKKKPDFAKSAGQNING